LKIKVRKELCSGCHICEMVCSLFHTGKINPEKSAIRIQKDDLEKSLHEPRVCLQCKRMKCMAGGEATMTVAERKAFIWDAKRADKCPFDALPVFEGKAYHCDLCEGDPQCVKACTTGAIRVQP